MIAIVFLVLGLVIGLAVGRWWAVALAIGPALWVGVGAEVDIPDWAIGALYGAITAAGIAAGVFLRNTADLGRFLDGNARTDS